MPEERPVSSKDDGKDQYLKETGKVGLEGRTNPLRSRSVVYSSIAISALLLLSAGVVVHIITGAIGKENDRIIEATTAAIDKKFDKLIESTSAERNVISDNIGRESEKNVRATAVARDDILRILAKDAAPAGNSAVVGAKQAAAGQRALDLGKKAFEIGQTDKALLYFIDGVNHDPGRMELVQSIAEAALKSGTYELVERALGILELTTVQVAPDDMSDVLDWITKLRAKFAPPPIPKMSPEDADKRIKKLYAIYTLNAIWTDGLKIDSGLSEIEFFQQMIDASRAADNDDRYIGAINKSAELAANLQLIQGILPMYHHVQSCLAQMQVIVKADAPDLAQFSSVSAASQGVLGQIWGRMAGLPSEMQKELQSLPSRMRTIEEGLQEKTSVAPYNRAVVLLNTAESDKSGNFTDRIKRNTKLLEKAVLETDAITSVKLRLQLFEKIRNTRDELAQIELARRAAYQKWALECANGFMEDWNNKIRVSADEAKQFFGRHEIAQIDETLVVPEVARVLSRVMSCMTGKLNAVDGSTTEYQMAATLKKRLGDF